MHIPERAHRAQFLNRALHRCNRRIYVGFRRKPPDGHANRAVREFVAATQRSEHVARLQRRARTRRSRTDRDLFHAHDEAFAFDVVEADVQVMRNALLHVTVDEHFGNVFKSVVQAVAQHADALVLRRHFDTGQTERFAHADDLVRRQRARAKAAFVSAAVNLRL